MRVHELAKELNLSSKELMDKIHAVLNIDAKNHMAALSEDQVASVRKLLTGAGPAIKASPKIVAAKQAPEDHDK